MTRGDECWVPDLFEKGRSEGWGEYHNRLYASFCHDFLSSHPLFKGMPVLVRKYPITDGIQEGFWHITCRDYNHDGNRTPEPSRCERIKWPRAFIENHGRCPGHDADDCGGVLLWSFKHRNKSGHKVTRWKMLLPEERYFVVLEQRKDRFFLITAYPLENDGKLSSQLKDYEAHKQP